MRGYDFLKEHEFFATTREFGNYTVYVFRKKEDGVTKKGTIQVATTTDGDFDWFYSETKVDDWFKEIIEKSEIKSRNLFRLRKVAEGKIG